MTSFHRGLVLAALCLFAPLALAKKAPRDPAADLAVMRTLPVYLIVPSTPLRGTIPLMIGGNPYDQEQAGLRAFAPYGKLFGGANRSPGIALFTLKWLKSRGVNLNIPGMRTLRAAGCLVDDSGDVAQRIANTIRDAPGFADTKFIRADSHEQIRDIPRIEAVATSSITPDFSAIVTTYFLQVYSPDMPKAPHSWKARPTIAYQFAVVSDAIDPPVLAATQATATPPPVEDEENDGSSGKWKVAIAAARRARQWADNSCSRVNEQLAANKAEADRLVALAMTGQLPTDLPLDWNRGGIFKDIPTRNLPIDPAELTQRRLYNDEGWQHAKPPQLYVSRRAGDDVVIDFRFAWVPDDSEAAYDEMHAKDAGEARQETK
jgi:hypothetical protein